MSRTENLSGRELCLSNQTFEKLGSFIHSQLGIKMPASKRQMVESRLRKRLVKLDMHSYDDYCRFLFSPEGSASELGEFINQITTNKTDFFREPAHFTFLENQALPLLLKGQPTGFQKHFRIWSAASSRGHEPYTIAMVMNEFCLKNPRMALDYDILGTDISSRVLTEARQAVYDHEEVAPVSISLRKKYLLRSKNARANLVRIVPGLRHKVRFIQMNLMDSQFDIKPGLDIVFCRNVMIYFDRETQDRLLKKICTKIRPGGYLFMGHSEVIHDRNLPLEAVAPTVYIKRG